MNIYFDELYKFNRTNELLYVPVPFAKGTIKSIDDLVILDNETALPTQKKVTGFWDDGSVKWAFFRFLGNLPKCSKYTFTLGKSSEACPKYLTTTKTNDSITLTNGLISFSVKNNSDVLFENFSVKNATTTENDFLGPILSTYNDAEESYKNHYDTFEIIEEGDLYTKILGKGFHISKNNKIAFEIEISLKPLSSNLDIDYRIINTTHSELKIKDILFELKLNNKANPSCFNVPRKGHDSTGCGDQNFPLDCQKGPVYHTMGVLDFPVLEDKMKDELNRTIVASSNYRTEFYVRNDGGKIKQIIDSTHIINEANEHYPEVFYGTFFADVTNDNYGVMATIFKAHQNYPKAISANPESIKIYIVPECDDKVVMQSGMARTQSFMINFHESNVPVSTLNNESLLYQMPDRAHLSEDVYRDASVSLDVFVKDKNPVMERDLIARADSHAKCFGMLCYGDAPDPGYTKQGRGNGELVWTNNEYDRPHALALLYMRSGYRRFEDYMIVATEHWMDVDICHYSDDPLRIGGQWEHTNGHCKNGLMVCSHEWVEGLLDCYHLTGNKRCLDSALGIGENVCRLLDTPMFKQKGEINARETGWAMRTLVALYIETNDDYWISKCPWIVSHFEDWEAEYGHWLSPYTDATAIRVPFMISIAVGSLMRYYRIRKDEKVKNMILRAIDDMVDNCILDNGLFYYKQLPSINRLGNNTLVLEAMTIGFELTNDIKYLHAGIPTLRVSINAGTGGAVGTKVHKEDAVIAGNGPTKNFAQSFIPLVCFYKACQENGLGEFVKPY